MLRILVLKQTLGSKLRKMQVFYIRGSDGQEIYLMLAFFKVKKIPIWQSPFMLYVSEC